MPAVLSPRARPPQRPESATLPLRHKDRIQDWCGLSEDRVGDDTTHLLLRTECSPPCSSPRPWYRQIGQRAGQGPRDPDIIPALVCA